MKFYDPEVFSWSPDRDHIAFWLGLADINQSITGTFAILDVVTGEITDYCISAGFLEGVWFNRLSVPAWSPDGKYLAINANIQKNGNFDTLLVDLEDGTAFKIGENLSPVGWLITSQK